jgi:hypothetical protein
VARKESAHRVRSRKDRPITFKNEVITQMLVRDCVINLDKRIPEDLNVRQIIEATIAINNREFISSYEVLDVKILNRGIIKFQVTLPYTSDDTKQSEHFQSLLNQIELELAREIDHKNKENNIDLLYKDFYPSVNKKEDSEIKDRKYQIFISSTFHDLIKVRETAVSAILEMHHFPIGMEMFSADDDDQWKVIADTIDSCDYYIVIIGYKYGSETKEGISYTEKEYDYARSKSIPILTFIRQRDVSTLPSERDDDPDKSRKLEMFIKKAKKDKMCTEWATAEDFGRKLAISLFHCFTRHPRTGWVRSDFIFEELHIKKEIETTYLKDLMNSIYKKYRLFGTELIFPNVADKKIKFHSHIEPSYFSYLINNKTRNFSFKYSSQDDPQKYFIFTVDNDKPYSIISINLPKKKCLTLLNELKEAFQ